LAGFEFLVHLARRFAERAVQRITHDRHLMIHDLDILQQLLGHEPTTVEAVGVPVLTPNIDIANARLVYPCGCVANLTASRVSVSPMRMIRFFQPDGYFSVDFLNQAGVVARRAAGPPGGSPQIVAAKVEVAPGDALLGQLRAFVGAVRTRERPRVDGLNGLGALRTAVRVHDAIMRDATRVERPDVRDPGLAPLANLVVADPIGLAGREPDPQ
jgi:predicted dehydrogenase